MPMERRDPVIIRGAVKSRNRKTVAWQSGENACHVGIALIEIAFLTTVNFCIDHWQWHVQVCHAFWIRVLVVVIGGRKRSCVSRSLEIKLGLPIHHRHWLASYINAVFHIHSTRHMQCVRSSISSGPKLKAINSRMIKNKDLITSVMNPDCH